MGYFVRDGGSWIANNVGCDAGGSAPKQVGYEYRWRFNNSAVENTICGIFENGERRDFARSIFVWNAKFGQVEQFIFGPAGGVGHGFEVPKGDGVIEDELVWTNRNGKDVQLKDWVKITGANSFDNVTYVKNSAGKWEVQPCSERQYRRVPR